MNLSLHHSRRVAADPLIVLRVFPITFIGGLSDETMFALTRAYGLLPV